MLVRSLLLVYSAFFTSQGIFIGAFSFGYNTGKDCGQQQHRSSHSPRRMTTTTTTTTTSRFLRDKIRVVSLSNRGLLRWRSFLAMSSSSEALGDESHPTENQAAPKAQLHTKVHTVTVCVVPPPENIRVWKALSEMRSKLKDPGFYRWPPHVNLMYPFLKLPDQRKNSESDGSEQSVPLPDNVDDDDDDDEHSISNIVERLESATRKMEPFLVRLNTLGTFGGKKRGVLWLHPDSSNDLETESEPSPLITLQTLLEEAFPMCRDQSQKGGSFTPHMTLSHFPSLDEASNAKEDMELSSPFIRADADADAGAGADADPNDPIHSNSDDCLEFMLDRIYLLQRKGDGGQFLRVAEIALGDGSDASNAVAVAPDDTNRTESMTGREPAETKMFDPPRAFPDMPTHEAEWVHNERMQLKSRRRRSNGKRGGGKRRQWASRGPRIPDTPEVIAEKRAQRKAKRERLIQEQREQEQDI